MSQHPSLKTSKTGKKHRTVLKRYEKLSVLKEKGILKEDDSVFGMPKLKIIRTKIKKEKAEEKPKEGEVQAPGTEATQAKEAPKKEKPGK
ncbi:MAG: small basic protein [Candidatus Omnitrophota bacterium]